MPDPIAFATRLEHRGGHVQDYVSRNEKASLGILQKCVTSCLYYCTQKCNTVRHEVSMGKPPTSRIIANWEKHVFVSRVYRPQLTTDKRKMKRNEWIARKIPLIGNKITGIARLFFSSVRILCVRAAPYTVTRCECESWLYLKDTKNPSTVELNSSQMSFN